jgi:BlaI family penicillinase repressor
MDHSKQHKPRIAEQEWEILKPFWEHGPLAARDVYAHLKAHKPWAYKTVKTMLGRLVAKGALAYDQVGNSYLYRAVYTRDEMVQHVTKSFVNRIFDGALSPFVAHFAAEISDAELKALQSELKRIMDERKNAP